ncbi:DUF692 domain-containing protein [Aquipseudomonas campi]|uniref:DUF692 domain-containing protein n=1 Tax=Aquipseudomonas campi TaxID=2731681 RepID=A0A6M8F4G2_9GAMM|nr:DUF692 domain-containing protein [Pseudomonas campi]QKE63414.1 DUF692 domain-containing protein [Pseudomonas campi]
MNCKPLQAGAGVAFKPQYFEALLADPQRLDFIEIHAENYFGAGGLLHAQMGALREHLPLSVHGVGLSLGGTQALDAGHLQRLAELCRRYEPVLVSEHLAWSSHAGVYLGDLLPIAYDRATLDRLVEHVDQLQCALQREVLIENPAACLRLAHSEMSEVEFLHSLSQHSGCGVLLDLNNLLISSHNCGGDPWEYLQQLPPERVGEVHLASHTRVELPDGESVLVDEHGSAVADATWQLYAEWVRHAGKCPTLVEWDRNLPTWSVLAAEADCVRSLQCVPFMPAITLDVPL